MTRESFISKRRLLFAIMCILTSSVCASAQSARTNIPSPLIDEDSPGSHVTYVGTYTSEYHAKDESGKKVVLRLHNNYRFNIQVSTYNVEDEPVFVNKERADVLGVEYDLILYSGKRNETCSRRFTQELLTVIELGPGKELLFTVPIEHVTPRSEIRVPFTMGNERMTRKGGPPPEHCAVFLGKFLPSGEKPQK